MEMHKQMKRNLSNPEVFKQASVGQSEVYIYRPYATLAHEACDGSGAANKYQAYFQLRENIVRACKAV